MSEIKYITLGDGSILRLAAGVHHAAPIVVEASAVSARVVLEAGAKLHATAFVLAGDEAVTEAVTGHGTGCATNGAAYGAAYGAANSTANGGGSPRLELTVDIVGPGAEFNLDALFIAHGTGAAAGKTDIDVTVNHLAPDCVSRQLIKGIAAGEATGSFTGLVHVAREAQRTDASQRSQNLQLSDTAHVFARPQLKIYADDVRCGHGATVGRLDDEAVYYMRQRGVSEAEARRMQLHGFAADIVNRCPSEILREDISARIEAIIDRF